MRHLYLYVSCIMLALLAGCVSSGKFQAKVDEAGRYQVEVAQLLKEVAGLTAERDSLQMETERMQGENAEMVNRLAIIEATNADLQAAMEASRAEKDQMILKLSNDKQTLESELASLKLEHQALRDRLTKEQQDQAMKMVELQNTYGRLVEGLTEQIGLGQIRIDSLANRLQVNIIDQVLFLSGESVVRTTGRKVLDAVANAFKMAADQKMVIEGHTDNVPIGEKLRDRYPTNWELSAARATNVARYLIEQGGIDPQGISVAAYGEYKPVATNTTKEGRASNRRIEILFLPSD
ncbi:MAG: OmpA family protein [Fidelibacterota bacterium]|nr:MAG: OmpA family protein [Candidatus Neomarinimicrobiota bacterium]